jgi:inorganic pyrophosphatase
MTARVRSGASSRRAALVQIQSPLPVPARLSPPQVQRGLRHDALWRSADPRYGAVVHPWHDLEPGSAAPDLVTAVVEIPKGSRHKYEIDKPSGAFRLDRVLHSSVHYPVDYGFVPRTLFDDGDPLDVLVVTTLPTFTGCLVEARPVGLFRMTDQGVADDKVLAVSHRDPSLAEVREASDLPAHLLRELEHFFRIYTQLEGKRVETFGWGDLEAARRCVRRAMSRYDERHGSRPNAQ